jgi:hypothetical protein
MQMATQKKHTENKSAQQTEAAENVIEKKGFLRRLGAWIVPAILLIATGIYYWPILSAQGFLWNDFIEQNYAYRFFSAVSLKQGVMPFWNPYVFSGLPFFSDVQAAVLYPLNLLLTLFASPTWLSPVVVEYQVVLHIFLAGFFMYLLVREWGCNRSGALCAGLIFMFCGFFSTHIFHVNLIQTAAWFPLIILLFNRAIKRLSVVYAAGTALLLCIAFLCGYPQLMLHMYYWLTAYFLYIIISNFKQGTTLKREALRGLMFGVIVALGLGMSLVQLLPTQELANNSVRPSLEFQNSCEGSFRPYRFITMLAPNFFGQPNNGGAYWGIAENDFNSGSHYYWETAMYAGIVSLLLAALALIFCRSPLTFFLASMALLSFLLAMGDSFFLYGIAYNVLPGVKSFRVPGRFALMLTLSVAALAGFGLQWLQDRAAAPENAHAKKITGRVLLVGMCVAFIAGIIVSSGALKDSILQFMLNSGRFGSDSAGISQYIDSHLYAGVASSVWTAIGCFVAGAAIIYLRLKNKINAPVLGILLCSVLFVDMMLFGYGFASSDEDPSVAYGDTPTIEQIHQQESQELFRINSRDSRPGTDDLGGPNMAFYKNQGSINRLFLMEGYNPLRLKRELTNRKEKTLDILNVKYAIQTDPQTRTMGFVQRTTYAPRCRMLYNYVVEPDNNKILSTLYSDSFNHQTTAILEEQPSLAINGNVDTASMCRITSYTINTINMDVTTGQNGLLMLSEIYFPEWKAKVDGKPVSLYRADYALRAIPVTAGHHSVTCYYDPQSFKKGLHLSLIALCITVGMGGAGIAIGRKKKA